MEAMMMLLMMFVGLCLAIIMAAVAAVVMIAVIAWVFRLARALIARDQQPVVGPFEWLGPPWL